MTVLTRSPGDAPVVLDVYAAGCPAREVLNLVTSRWAVLVVGALEGGPLRFGALRRRLEGITQKVLTDKLRDLEAEGLLTRTTVDRPLAVYYELTDVGRSLTGPLAALREWAQEHCDGRPDAGRPRTPQPRPERPATRAATLTGSYTGENGGA